MVTLLQARPVHLPRHGSLDALLARVEAGDEVAETEFIARVREERKRFVAGLEEWLEAMGRRGHEGPIPPRHGGGGLCELKAALERWPAALGRLAPLLCTAVRETQRDQRLDTLTRGVTW
jgi:hypothetical protein